MSDQSGQRREVPLACRNFVGVVEVNTDGIPVVFRRRCKNKECCQPRDGWIAVHRWTIYGRENGHEVGRYTTEYLPMRPASELVAVPTEQAAARRPEHQTSNEGGAPTAHARLRR